MSRENPKRESNFNLSPSAVAKAFVNLGVYCLQHPIKTSLVTFALSAQLGLTACGGNEPGQIECVPNPENQDEVICRYI